MNRRILIALMTLVGSLSVACGDDDDDQSGSAGGAQKCEEAAKILEKCGQEPEEVSECNAEAQAEADCVIKHPEGACSEDFDDPKVGEFLACFLGG